MAGLLIAIASVSFLFVGLALDLAMIADRQIQMQTGCDSAALAGAAELWDSGLLSPQPDFTGRPPGQAVEELQRSQLAIARQTARYFAVQHEVAGQPLLVEANEQNVPGGDIVFGWVEDPRLLGGVMTPWDGFGPVNSVRVSASQRRQRGNPVSLWIGRRLGIDLVVSARATIDQRVYGFRPVDHVCIPALPLLVSTDPQSWLDRAGASPDQADDRYAIDNRTGRIELGSDGVAEIVLHVGLAVNGSETLRAGLFSLHGQPPDDERLREWIHFGFTPEDLEPLGGQFALTADGDLILSAVPVEPFALETLAAALRATSGQKRIWSLGQWSEGPMCRVRGFAAGHLVDCYTVGESTLEIVVQPCPLQTCTALVRSSQPRNPWIGKATMTR